MVDDVINKGLVSFIIAAYNEDKFIVECVNSCLNQTYKNVEVVITDDGSTDNTYELVQETYRNYENVKIFKLPKNKGKIAAFNGSFRNSSGEFIAIIGADDINCLNRIEEQMKHMDKYDLNFTNLHKVSSDNSKIIAANAVQEPDKENREIAFEEMIIAPCTVATLLFKRSLAEKIFPIPENLPHEDWWIPFIASFYHKILFINKSLYLYRIHASNTSGVHYSQTTDIVKLSYKETRDKEYFENVLLFLNKNNVNKYNMYLELKICFLGLWSEAVRNKQYTGDLKELESKLSAIVYSNKEDPDALPYDIYESMIMYHIQKCLMYGLWEIGHIYMKYTRKLTRRNIKYRLYLFLHKRIQLA